MVVISDGDDTAIVEVIIAKFLFKDERMRKEKEDSAMFSFVQSVREKRSL